MSFIWNRSCLLYTSIIVLVTLLTYVVPAGQYSYVLDEATGYEVVDGDSFTYMEQSPVNPFRMFVAIKEGFLDGAQIIFLILFGYFWVYSVMQTGAFTAMINSLLKGRAKDSKLFIPIVMLVFALAGSTSVSYTHLDVYKRQYHRSELFSYSLKWISDCWRR